MEAYDRDSADRWNANKSRSQADKTFIAIVENGHLCHGAK